MRQGLQRVWAAIGITAAVTSFALAVTPNDTPALTPGVESTVDFSATAAMKVYLPSNYNANQKWPAVFYYHGMGEHPDTSLMRRFTDGRDFIVVGMPYVPDGDRPSTAQGQTAYLKSELASLHDARSWLTAHASVDVARLFMAGASKGGWTVAMLGEAELPRLGGLIILLAGRQAGQGPAPAAIKNLPIYIGSGETDPNLIAARRAREFYKRAGAVVSFEEFAGRGHEVPQEAPRLQAWLQVQGRYRQNPPAGGPQKEATQEFNGLFQAAVAETNALAQYDLLRALAEDPRLRLSDPAIRQQMSARFASLIQASPAREEWTAESAFNELLYQETCIHRLADMKAVLDGFQTLAQDHPQTRCGKLAGTYAPHLAEAYQKSQEATRRANPAPPPTPKKTVTPAFPTSGSSQGAIPIPVRRGNKITFEQPGEK